MQRPGAGSGSRVGTQGRTRCQKSAALVTLRCRPMRTNTTRAGSGAHRGECARTQGFFHPADVSRASPRPTHTSLNESYVTRLGLTAGQARYTCMDSVPGGRLRRTRPALSERKLMKSPQPPRPTRAVPASVPVAARSDTSAPDTTERNGARPARSSKEGTRPRSHPTGRWSDPESRPANDSGQNTAAGSGTSAADPAAQTPGDDTAVPRLTAFSSLGTMRRSVQQSTSDPSEVATEAEKNGGSGPGGETHTGPPQDPDTDAAATSGDAGTAKAATPTRRTPQAVLRGTHRGVLTAAACAGVVLVAGVLVSLNSGGSTHTAQSPDPAASLLDPDSDGGPRAGVPGALPVPSGNMSGTPSRSAGGTSVGSPHGKRSGGGASTGTRTSAGPHAPAGAPVKNGDAHPSTAHVTQAPTGTSGSGTASGSVSGVTVLSHASNRCIDVVGGKGKDGSPLEIWDCTGAASQKWTFAGDGTVRAFGLCMDAAGASTANGTTVQLANCNGGPAQQFRLNSEHDLVSTMAHKCVDVRDKQTANGSRLQLWSCTGTDNQKWSKG